MTARLTTMRQSTSDFRIPPMPQTLLKATEVMQAAGTPDPDVVIRLVENDPSVVARVLRITNSAYYGQRAEISSIRRAVVIIGPGAVVGLVMSMGIAEMQNAFDDTTMAPFLDIVRHSVATGFIAQEMTRGELSGDDESPSEAFTAGLLHDIGKLVLLYNHPKTAAELYSAILPHEILLEEEERIFETTHVRVGAAVAETLRLPESLKEVIGFHHSSNGFASDSLVHRIKLANLIAHVLGYPESVPGLFEERIEAIIPPDFLEYWKTRRHEVKAHVDGIM